MTNEQIRDEARKRVDNLVDEITEKAVAAGCSDARVTGYAHGKGSCFFRRYTGHVAISFTALAGGKPRKRTVNDCKKPINVDKIVALLVEHERFVEDRTKRWKEEFRVEDANQKAKDAIQAEAPAWLTITANSSGLGIQAYGLSAERARAIVDALKVLP
jgi:hypothetical protein